MFDDPDDSDDAPPAYTRRHARAAGPSWFGMFTASLAGTFLAGVLLLVGVRMYIHWSVYDTMQKVNKTMNETK